MTGLVEMNAMYCLLPQACAMMSWQLSVNLVLVVETLCHAETSNAPGVHGGGMGKDSRRFPQSNNRDNLIFPIGQLAAPHP